jgi:D-glycero-alpha-D-manno-heptose-7-phosphate kinase
MTRPPLPPHILLGKSSTIEEAFHSLNKNEMGIVFISDDSGRVAGCITDGDIRRQLLVKDDISVAVSHFMNREFQFAHEAASREHILKLLDHRVHVLPILDDEGRLVRIYRRDDFRLQEEMEVFARARAPARISFGGGGSDVTHYFFDRGGVVVSAAIAKYAHATLRRRADGSVRIHSHDLD